MSWFRDAVVVAIAASSAVSARADDASPPRDDEDDEAPRLHYEMAALEAAIVLAIPATAYWMTKNHQSIDWTMDWDWVTWRQKLFSVDKLRFDSNPFGVNAFRHSIAGILDYHIGRSNGFGMADSAAIAFGAGALWEYLIEYRENPSINDLIINGIVGLAVGEPLWQLGQLWRGGRMSLADRARTALFSPLDATHDLYRDPPRRRRRAWREIELGTGVTMRVEAGARAELAGAADLDLVSHAPFVAGTAGDWPTRPGAWSRIHGRVRFGDRGDGARITGAFLHSRTSLMGRAILDGSGAGAFLGIGTAFTYRREQLATEWERVAIAHLVGPQLQLSTRTARYTLRWDAAIYGDFAMTHAIVFGPGTPFPSPPPRVTALQTSGYYHAVGGSAISRLRAAAGEWRVDVELAGHRMWQLDIADRNNAADVTALSEPLTANGARDWRGFARLKLTYQPDRWGIAATADGAHRRGACDTLARALSDLTLGLVANLDL